MLTRIQSRELPGDTLRSTCDSRKQGPTNLVQHFKQCKFNVTCNFGRVSSKRAVTQLLFL